MVESLGELAEAGAWADEPDILILESKSVIRIYAESRMRSVGGNCLLSVQTTQAVGGVMDDRYYLVTGFGTCRA